MRPGPYIFIAFVSILLLLGTSEWLMDKRLMMLLESMPR